MSEHSKLSPSGFAANSSCSLRYWENQGPQEESQDAREGTAAHELLLDKWLMSDGPPTNITSYIASNGVVLDEDHLDYILKTYNFIVDFIVKFNGMLMVLTEVKVDPGIVIDDESVSWGTSDLVMYDSATQTLYVWDYKHGIGTEVEVRDNTQLTLYALGAMARYPHLKIRRVELGILQPRSFHPDGPFRFKMYPVERIKSWLGYFQERAELILDENLRRIAVPTVNNCRYCAIRATCKASWEKVVDALPRRGVNMIENTLVKPEHMTTLELKRAMDSAPFIIPFLKAVKEHVTAKLNTAAGFEGYKLVAGRGSQKFTEIDDQVLKIALYNLDLTEEDIQVTKLKSPAQMTKMAKRKLNKEKMTEYNALVVKTPGAPVAVPITDKRPSVRVNVNEVFKDIPTGVK